MLKREFAGGGAIAGCYFVLLYYSGGHRIYMNGLLASFRNRSVSVISYFITCIKFAPVLGVIRILLGLLAGGTSVYLIVAVGRLIDVVNGYVGGSGESGVWQALLVVGGVMLLELLFGELSKYVEIRIRYQIGMNLKKTLYNKATAIKYNLVEDEETWKSVNLINKDPEEKVYNGMVNFSDVITCFAKFIGYVIVLMQASVTIGLVLALLVIPVLYVARKLGEIDYRAFEKAEEVERRSDYFKTVLSSREYANERKVFGYKEYILQRWDLKFREVLGIYKSAFFKLFGGLGLTFAASRLYVAVIAMMLLYLMIQDRITVGAFISLTYYAFVIIDIMAGDVLHLFKAIIKNSHFFKMFGDFLELEERDEKTSAEEGAVLDDLVNTVGSGIKDGYEIEFKNVSFKYPKTDRYILKEVSFKLKNGTHTALVGKNGCGKTTLVKLMLGLFDTYEGEILINGVEVRDLSSDDISKIYEVAFQDFYRYYMTPVDYMRLGSETEVDMGKVESEVEVDMTKVESALNDAGILDKMKSFGDNLDYELGKFSSAVDLSGGEWQKLLISRVFYSDKPIRILDEPTAAIDPTMEADLYELFNKKAAGKTSMTITHRLGAARNADHILVLDDGRLVEAGSHDELVNDGGLYNDMYSLQKEWYHG